MAQYRNILGMPNVPALTVWTADGDFYWPDPTKFTFYNESTGQYTQNPNAGIADLPDQVHYYKDYVEPNTTWFAQI